MPTVAEIREEVTGGVDRLVALVESQQGQISALEAKLSGAADAAEVEALKSLVTQLTIERDELKAANNDLNVKLDKIQSAFQ